MTPQRLLAVASTVVFALLALAASLEILPRLELPVAVVATLFVILIGAGVSGGVATAREHRQINLERWQLVQDDQLTAGERQTAHREAERRSRGAGVLYFLAVVAPGAWLSYQCRSTQSFSATDLLILAPVAGFATGLWLGQRWYPTPGPDSV